MDSILAQVHHNAAASVAPNLRFVALCIRSTERRCQPGTYPG